MNKLVRYWNQNRGKIIITIAIIAFIIILIQIVNGILENSEAKRKESETIDYTKPVQSVITGEVVSEEKTTENTNIIKEFVDYCNHKEYNKAFEILSKDCKEIVFGNDINLFKTNYYNQIFSTTRTYDLNLWLNINNIYTYQIKYYEDNLLATGGGDLSKNVEDYITITKEDSEYKLNVNGFIQKKEINKSSKQNDIEININSKIIYQNYETYDITIKNYTPNTILINDGQNSEDIYLLDNRNVKYTSFIHEIPVEHLTLKSAYEKKIQIRFNKMHNLNRNIEKIVFQDIILNYEEYQKNPISENLQKASIEVEI